MSTEEMLELQQMCSSNPTHGYTLNKPSPTPEGRTPAAAGSGSPRAVLHARRSSPSAFTCISAGAASSKPVGMLTVSPRPAATAGVRALCAASARDDAAESRALVALGECVPLVLRLGELGSQVGQFNDPHGIFFSHEAKEIFVADSRNHRIVVFDGVGMRALIFFLHL